MFSELKWRPVNIRSYGHIQIDPEQVWGLHVDVSRYCILLFNVMIRILDSNSVYHKTFRHQRC